MSTVSDPPFHRVRSEPAFHRSQITTRGGSTGNSSGISTGSGSPTSNSVFSLAPPKTLSEKIAVSEMCVRQLKPVEAYLL